MHATVSLQFLFHEKNYHCEKCNSAATTPICHSMLVNMEQVHPISQKHDQSLSDKLKKKDKTRCRYAKQSCSEVVLMFTTELLHSTLIPILSSPDFKKQVHLLLTGGTWMPFSRAVVNQHSSFCITSVCRNCSNSRKCKQLHFDAPLWSSEKTCIGSLMS